MGIWVAYAVDSSAKKPLGVDSLEQAYIQLRHLTELVSKRYAERYGFEIKIRKFKHQPYDADVIFREERHADGFDSCRKFLHAWSDAARPGADGPPATPWDDKIHFWSFVHGH